MKRIFKYILALGAPAVLAGCASEAPFGEESAKGQGRLLTGALSVSISDKVNEVRASVTPSPADFDVKFMRGGKTEATYKFAAMPEVITLPAGDYSVVAWYGENPVAGFDAPYYEGSAAFTIEENKITDKIDPVVCSLSNVKVSVVFDSDLVAVMSDDTKVTVKMGSAGSLDFNKETAESGFFRYVEGSSTLAAVFSGTVEGEATSLTKKYSDVKPGNHYRLTFRLNTTSGEDPGYIDPGDPGNEINIDAKLEIIGLDTSGNGTDVPFDEENIDDDERPSTGGDPNDDPGKENEPPAITGLNNLKLNDGEVREGGVTNITSELPGDGANKVCTIRISSSAKNGIEEFTAEIVSEKLNPAELASVGLCNVLNLVNPELSQDTSADPARTVDATEPLEGLGLACHNKGMKTVDFNIGGFIPLLGILGEGDHYFILRVKDANGETVKTLKLTQQ